MTQVYSSSALEKGLTVAFLEQYETAMAANSLLSDLCYKVDSTSDSEKHEWLGQAPSMTEFKGETTYSGLTSTGYTIDNKVYTGGLMFSVDDIRRNKTGSFKIRINDLAMEAANHPTDNAISTLVANTVTGYDGVTFFNDSHTARKNEGGVQDNNLAISGVTTALIQTDLALALQAMLGFKNEEGKPFHRNVSGAKFKVLCPPGLYTRMKEALTAPIISSTSNVNAGIADLEVSALVTASTWYLLRTDSRKPLIYQPELGIEVKQDLVGEVGKRQIGFNVACAYGLGYGFWQSAIKVA